MARVATSNALAPSPLGGASRGVKASLPTQKSSKTSLTVASAASTVACTALAHPADESGAGGIGFYIQTYVRSFQYDKAASVTIAVVVMVMAIEAINVALRRRFT